MENIIVKIQVDIDDLKDAVKNIPNALKNVVTKMGGVVNNVKSFGGAVVNFFKGVAQGIREGAQEANQSSTQTVGLLTRLGNTIKGLATVPRALGGGIFSFFKGLASGVKQGVSETMRGSNKTSGLFSKLGSSIKKMATSSISHIKNLFSHTKKSEGMFGSFVKAGLSMLSLRKIFQLVASSFKEGFSNLAQVDERTNKSISMLQTSLLQLKNSLTTAFAPILTVVAPILTQFVDLLSQVASKVANFMAAITGQSSYMKAKKANVDYAKSLENTGKSAKKAKEENKKYMSGLDEIATYTPKEKKTDTDDKDTGMPAVGDMFEKVPTQISDLAKKLREAFEKGDWHEIGSLLANKMADMLEQIPWTDIKAKAAKIGTNLANLLNGIFGTLRLADDIGKTLAESINTLFAFTSNFVQTLEWGSIGEFIGTAVNSALSNIEWQPIYDTMTGLGSGIASTIMSAFGTIDWELVGTSVSNGLNALIYSVKAFFDTIDLFEIGGKLAAAASAAIQNTDWREMGTQLMNIVLSIPSLIVGFIQDLDMAAVGTAISDFFIGAFDKASDWIQSVDWQNLGEQIKTLVCSIDWGGVATSLFTALGSALGGLAAFIWGIIGDAWASVCEWWKEKAYIDGEFNIFALFEGILAALKNVASWIKENIFLPFVQGFMNAFGIKGNASEVMHDLGQKMIQGVLNGISSLVEKVKNIWKSLKDATVLYFNSMWEQIKKPINAIIGGVEKMVNGIIKGFNKAIDAITNLKFDIPDWVPLVGGKSIGFDIPTLKEISIPKLATGAVIPPNAPFLATLGDQKNGNNLELPENLLRQVVREESGSGGGYRFTAMINRRVLFDEFITEAKLRQSMSGRNPLELA